jgi:hypothetical protein
MANYAFMNNIAPGIYEVTEVITGRNEWEVVDGISDWEKWYGDFRKQKCVRTSYNTVAGKHILDGTPFRGNYAGIGYIYDEKLDAFYAPQPFASWVLDEETYQWQAPTPMPTDGKFYEWDEATLSWKEVSNL